MLVVLHLVFVGNVSSGYRTQQCSADIPRDSATSSRGIRGYIALKATSFVKKNLGTYFIDDVFISYKF